MAENLILVQMLLVKCLVKCMQIGYSMRSAAIFAIIESRLSLQCILSLSLLPFPSLPPSLLFLLPSLSTFFPFYLPPFLLPFPSSLFFSLPLFSFLSFSLSLSPTCPTLKQDTSMVARAPQVILMCSQFLTAQAVWLQFKHK